MAAACVAPALGNYACFSEPLPLQPKELFVNDDSCGDWLIPHGRHGYSLQLANASSACCFIVAGAQLVCCAEAPIARAYGLMMCAVGVGSCSFHATSSLSGFLVDIVPMAVTAALMLFKGVHALQADAGFSGPKSETNRWFISMGAAVFAVYFPWTLMQAGVSHYTVWGVWAVLFGSMGAAFGVISLIVFANEGMLNGHRGRDLLIAIACVLLGLGATVHSFLPGLCEGWRTVVPLHAVWHLFSSVTANRCGHILDALTDLVDSIETRNAQEGRKKGNKPLLGRLMKRDFFPSQFSM